MRTASRGSVAEMLRRRLQVAEYRGLVFTARWCRSGLLDALWTQWWVTSTPRMSGSCRLRLHGRPVQLNVGFAYPAFKRKWPTYNEPLVSLATAMASVTPTPLTVVDVGAAVGDTVLLLAERMGPQANHFVCVEPDAEFAKYLEHNVAHLGEIEIHRSMLADDAQPVPAPVRIHSGTNSPQGSERVPSTTLDRVLRGRDIHVLKVDTDGFDGKVLAGATGVLRTYQPAVIFEWHPKLLVACGQDVMQPFRTLQDCGYESFLWFTKHGRFDHREKPHDPVRSAQTATSCLQGDTPEPDWHFDVIALPRPLEALAEEIVTGIRASP